VKKIAQKQEGNFYDFTFMIAKIVLIYLVVETTSFSTPKTMVRTSHSESQLIYTLYPNKLAMYIPDNLCTNSSKLSLYRTCDLLFCVML
jgi:hypothetical protein